MSGSEKQVVWARELRIKYIEKSLDFAKGEADEEGYMEKVRAKMQETISLGEAATFWINMRSMLE